MATTHSPAHPGEVLRDSAPSDTTMTVTEFAKRLGVRRVALSRVLNSEAAVSAGMPVRLAAALDGSVTSWLRMQADYDLCSAPSSARTGGEHFAGVPKSGVAALDDRPLIMRAVFGPL